MDLIQQIFAVIGQAITSFTTALTSAVEGVAGLFYVEPSGTETTGHMTFLGVLLLIGAGVGLVYFAVRWISRLVRRA